MRRVVAVDAGLHLVAVLVVVVLALLGEVGGEVLDDGAAGDDDEHLHTAAHAHHGDVVVEAVAHGEVVRHVARGVVVLLSFDAVPRLGVAQQRGGNVLAAGEDHGTDTLNRSAYIRIVVASLHHVGILQQQHVVLVDIFRCEDGIDVVPALHPHLRQQDGLGAGLAQGADDVGIELRLGVGAPGDTYAHGFFGGGALLVEARGEKRGRYGQHQ